MKHILIFAIAFSLAAPAYAENNIKKQQPLEKDSKKRSFFTIDMTLFSIIIAGLGFRNYRQRHDIINGIKTGDIDSIGATIISSALFLLWLNTAYEQYQEYKK